MLKLNEKLASMLDVLNNFEFNFRFGCEIWIIDFLIGKE